MNMTREEVKQILSDWNLCHYTPSKEAAEAVISAIDPLDIITALRGPTREMVERMFPGCRSCKSCRSCVFSIHELKDMPCKKCDPNAECVLTEYKPSKFCPACGKPLTDEAVDILWKRWKEAVDNDN